MADTTVYPALSACVTTADHLSSIPIKNARIIFIRDRHRIAFDYKDKRIFYNQIVELDSEEERQSLTDIIDGTYYLVINTAILWYYHNSTWIQVSTPPHEVFFIGTEFPEFGSVKTLYIDKRRKEISVWDEATSEYITVADKTQEITAADIDVLFQK